MGKNYWFYYYLSFAFINQNEKEFDFIGLDYFRWFEFKLSIYKANKTRLPAIVFKVIVAGVGFELCTHGKR